MPTTRIPAHLQPWIDARKRHKLSHAHVQMARELGMNPKKLGKLDNDDQEPWKLPLPAFIEHLYAERYGKSRPVVVHSIEESVKLQAQKRKAKHSVKHAGSQAPADDSLRNHLLRAVLRFVEGACTIPRVARIALIGSLTTPKTNPKDADVLVFVADDADLESLAAAGRRLKGAAQHRNCGADIFIANLAGEYRGRTCHWRECRPGVRVSCDARHCGKRPYLHDDLDVVTLETATVKSPQIDLWPAIERRCEVPQDVEELLLRPLGKMMLKAPV